LEIPSGRRLAERLGCDPSRHQHRSPSRRGSTTRRGFPVNLPHDWAIALPFDRNGDDNTGFRQLGPKFPSNSIAWYRRTFELPSGDSGKRIWLTFDGAFRDTTVWVNGWLVRHHEGGYNPFREDITEVVRLGGRNTVACGWMRQNTKVGIMRARAFTAMSGWTRPRRWPSRRTGFLFIPNSRTTFRRTRRKYTLKRVFSIRSPMPRAAMVNCEIISPDGKSLAHFKESEKVAAGSQGVRKLESKLSSPVLWSPESPKLYKLITTVSVGGKTVDQQETVFGIRTLAFDPTNGFLLNGKHYELQGVCIHQDWPGVGVAVPDSLQPSA
jgi:beta-galactosidase